MVVPKEQPQVAPTQLPDSIVEEENSTTKISPKDNCYSIYVIHAPPTKEHLHKQVFFVAYRCIRDSKPRYATTDIGVLLQ